MYPERPNPGAYQQWPQYIDPRDPRKYLQLNLIADQPRMKNTLDTDALEALHEVIMMKKYGIPRPRYINFGHPRAEHEQSETVPRRKNGR